MVAALDKFIEITWKILKAVLVVMLTVMVVILCAHIFCRYVLNDSLTWSEELLKAMLVWFGMLSVAVLAARREHVSIVFFKELMPKSVQNFLDKAVQGLVVVICILVTVVGVMFVLGAGSRLTPALRWPYWSFYLAIPVSFALVSIYELRNFLVDLTGKGKHAAIDKPDEDLTGGTGEVTL